jgi:hypothetical protein
VSSGVAGVLDSGSVNASFIIIAVAGLLLVFALWWLYFIQPWGAGLARRRDRYYPWGYGQSAIATVCALLVAFTALSARRPPGNG